MHDISLCGRIWFPSRSTWEMMLKYFFSIAKRVRSVLVIFISCSFSKYLMIQSAVVGVAEDNMCSWKWKLCLIHLKKFLQFWFFVQMLKIDWFLSHIVFVKSFWVIWESFSKIALKILWFVKNSLKKSEIIKNLPKNLVNKNLAGLKKVFFCPRTKMRIGFEKLCFWVKIRYIK